MTLSIGGYFYDAVVWFIRLFGGRKERRERERFGEWEAQQERVHDAAYDRQETQVEKVDRLRYAAQQAQLMNLGMQGSTFDLRQQQLQNTYASQNSYNLAALLGQAGGIGGLFGRPPV